MLFSITLLFFVSLFLSTYFILTFITGLLNVFTAKKPFKGNDHIALGIFTCFLWSLFYYLTHK